MRCNHQILIFGVLVVASSLCFAGETEEERLVRLQSMSALEKDQLRRNQERFEKLSPQEQQQLRALEDQLAKDPKGEHLRQLMLQYHEWLRALPSAERAALRSLKEEDRVPKIKMMLVEQESERLRELAKESLTPEDVAKVRAWLADLVLRRKAELMKELPPELQQKLAGSRDSRQITFEFMTYMRARDRSRPPQILESLKITEDDRQRLLKELSGQARDVYSKANSDTARNTVFQNWVFLTFRFRPPPSPDELRELLQRMSSEDRDRLENLPPDQMKAELMRQFFARRWEKDGLRPHFGGDRSRDRSGEPSGGPPKKEDYDRKQQKKD